MALPATLDPTAPAGSASPAQGDDQLRALKQLIADLFGLPPDPTPLTAAPFTIGAGGVVTVAQNNLVFQAGTVSAPSWAFSGDLNTGIYSAAPDTLNIATGGKNTVQISATGIVTLRTDTGGFGPVIDYYHDSSSPAASDTPVIFRVFAKDSGGTNRNVANMFPVFNDVTLTTMDSSWVFQVMNNVNAADVNTSATLSSLGVWTNASSGAIKEYIGDFSGSVLERAKQLTTLGIYRGKNIPAEKQVTAEVHYSPTAEEFYQVFELGTHPQKTQHPGIAAVDVAWLAVKMGLELDARVAALEGK